MKAMEALSVWTLRCSCLPLSHRKVLPSLRQEPQLSVADALPSVQVRPRHGGSSEAMDHVPFLHLLGPSHWSEYEVCITFYS